MSDFLSHFCEILPTNLKFLCFTLFHTKSPVKVGFGSKKHAFFDHFRVFFAPFCYVGSISDPVLEGGL